MIFKILVFAVFAVFSILYVDCRSVERFKPYIPKAARTVKLLHVIFRHGNRTANGPEELYPNDPYLNKTYFPTGLGQLTNAGKQREFSVGLELRERYGEFLGDIYYPGLLDPWSTDYNRTKASLLYALAGLFPPRREQIWNAFLSWQAIPYNFVKQSEDKVMIGSSCPYYKKMYEENINSQQQQQQFKKYEADFKYISENTGINVTSFEDVYRIYFGLSTEAEYGLKLPLWTNKVWPEKLTNLAIKEYGVSMATTELRRMAAGYMLKKILSDTVAKQNESKNTEFKRKMHMYSCHENNLAEMLILLDVFNPHVPTYGSYLILEIHEIGGEEYVQILYQNYSTNKPEVLKIPACNEMCPLKQFVELFSEYIPTEQLCGN